MEGALQACALPETQGRGPVLWLVPQVVSNAITSFVQQRTREAEELGEL